jgi:hypothetical protein
MRQITLERSSVESLMKLAGFPALKLSQNSFIAEKAPLNEPADAGGII